MLCSVVHSLRFDLIFLMLDPQDEFYDRRLATHLVSLYHQTQEEEEEEFLVSKTRFFSCFSVVVFCTIWGISCWNRKMCHCITAIQHQTIK